MSKKLFRKVFPFLAVLLLAPWPVAYAHTYDNSMGGGDSVRIEVAEASMMPTWTAFRRAIGGVASPGDLFYIDATNNAADVRVELYLTNARELIGCYRYLILRVGVYTEGDAGEWEASWYGGEPLPEIFITLRDAQVNFTLPGYARYKVTIDSGSFYCTNTEADGGSLSPCFYLAVE